MISCMRVLGVCALPLLLAGLSPRGGAIELIDRPSTGRQFETLRFRFEENLHFSNPFDLETNRVELLIQQPDFSTSVLSFFYDGVNQQGVERWEARLTPAQAGPYLLHVRINGNMQAPFQVRVEANTAARQGGLAIAGVPGVFAYESGEAFRGIGINVCWTDDYEHYFRKMKAAGMNVTRVWMCPWNLPLEWKESGLGRYNLASARKLDDILRLAERYGIYIILCMDFHGVAPKGLGFFKENRWPANPYNEINGGPCKDAAELFSNAVAGTFLKKKYKYIVSRFGASPHIAAWEFFNEADLVAGRAIPVNRWHVEMAEYVHSIDVHHRLVSSSSTRRYMEKVVDAFRSPALDFVMYHDYNMPDVAPHFVDMLEVGVEYYRKPVVLGEFGVEFRGGDRTYKVDPNHVGLHNGIWSGWFSETPVIPLSWWWDSYIDRYDLWNEFAVLTKFADSTDLDIRHLVFKTLPPGLLRDAPGTQVACMVRCMYTGDHAALWFKNDDYKWSLIAEGVDPKDLGAFLQVVPHLVPGRYSIIWFDTHTGVLDRSSSPQEVRDDGVLKLLVPSFAKDRACLLRREAR